MFKSKKSTKQNYANPINVLVLFFTLAFGLGLITSCEEKQQNDTSITIYPEIENLEEIKGLSESSIFDMTVNDKNVFVYHSREIADEYEHVKQQKSVSYTGVSYVNFSMAKKVNIKINSINGKATNWKVMPHREGFQIDSENNVLTLTLDKPEKFVVSAIINGKEHSFIVSADQPETNIPSIADEGVLYLNPGIHKYGQAWDPYVNGIHTVYISGGAVLEATIKAKNKKNVKLLGRGIISQSFVMHAEETSSDKNNREEEWDADWLGVVFIDSQNIEIDGIAIVSSPSYQLEVANCIDVSIKNVKLCGFGEHNNDGIHTYSTNVLLEDSFIASNDDRICITGLYDKDGGSDNLQWDGSNKLTGVSVSNITIRNMVFWGLDNNGGDIMLTWNGSGFAKDILIENVVSLTATNKAFITARHGGSADIHNVTIKNIELFHGNLFDIEIGESNYQGTGGGKIRKIYLENIVLNTSNARLGKQLLGENEKSYIEEIKLKNIRTNEGLITSLDQLNLTTNSFVSNLEIIK